jgi:hypothetical protein
MRRASFRCAGLLCALLFGWLLAPGSARAVEGGGSNYPLGKRGPVAALATSRQTL